MEWFRHYMMGIVKLTLITVDRDHGIPRSL